MTHERREYKGGAAVTTLLATINESVGTFTVDSGTNFPTGSVGPFFVAIDRGQSSEEVLKITSRSGNTFTVGTRGADGTVPSAHLASATVEHVHTATDADEANSHYSVTTYDHHTQYLNNARHDTPSRHTFGGAYGTPEAPSASSPGNAASAGTGDNPAREDHVHARESIASLVAAVFPVGMIMPYAGEVAPSGFGFCDGALYSRTTFAGLFAVLGTRWGAGDGTTTFAVPDLRGRTVVGAGAGAGLTNRVIGTTFGAETHLLTLAEIPSHNHTLTSDGGTGITVTGTTAAEAQEHTHNMNHDHSVGGGLFGNQIVITAGASSINMNNTAPSGQAYTYTGIDDFIGSTGGRSATHNHTFTGTGTLAAHTHTVGNNGGGTAHNNMQPSMALNYVIKL